MNKKGFTLVELLAVIVILAILMVSAGAGVMSTMNNSKINTFKNEALQAVNSAEDMYSDISMVSDISVKYLKTSEEGDYQGMCVSLVGLVNNGFLKKDISTYGGMILLEVPYDGGATKYEVWMHNGQYGIYGIEKNSINKLKYKKDNNPTNTASSNQAGGLGIITKLDGLKAYIAPSMGYTDKAKAVGSAWNTASNSGKSSAKYTSLKSPDTSRGGTGNTYKDIECINANIEQAS